MMIPAEEKHKQYAFTINEDRENPQTFYFLRDHDGNPIKLGDGTFGVVYQVENEQYRQCAVKLLYHSQAVSPSATKWQIDEETIDEFYKKFANVEEPIIAQLKKLQTPVSNWFSFFESLSEISLEAQQFHFLFKQILQRFHSIALERFEFEMTSADKILARLLEKGQHHEFVGVIEILGGTNNFHKSEAYKTLKEIFNKAQMNVSPYALVMPLYEWTLKELLERKTTQGVLTLSAVNACFPSGKIPEEVEFLIEKSLPVENLVHNIQKLEELTDDQKKQLEKNIYEQTGYDLLKAMPFDRRIQTMLPYLLDIGQGLKALHLTGLFHYDIKPANIFVKRQGDMVQAVVGDLGFLENQNLVSTVTAKMDGVLPLGTLHYRSPEQKDYFDLCDVEIAHEGEAGKEEVVLISVDPKFRYSIIEPGDELVFNKISTGISLDYFADKSASPSHDQDMNAHEARANMSRNKYTIKKIRKNPDAVRIWLKGEPQRLIERLKLDKRTQVMFYKKQATRTDLFGLGAVIFDMLTCGDSPEKFYENIRSYDTDKQDIETIMGDYRQVSSYQSNKPGIVQIFEPFRDKTLSTYAPEKVVELILKCLLYKVNNTFYNQYRAEEHAAVLLNEEVMSYPIDAALKQLQALESFYHGDRYNNVLITQQVTAQTPTEYNKLSEIIERLQQFSQTDQLPLRLARGIWYLVKLVELVQQTLTNSEKGFFLAEMEPDNIQLATDAHLVFRYPVYKTERDYHDDLRSDRVHMKLTRDITHPFVPNELTFLRRTIRLTPDRDEPNVFRYRFSDSSLFGSQVNTGDWVLVKDRLERIEHASESSLTVQAGFDVDLLISDDEDGTQSLQGVYYRNVEPCQYYLQMLGIYLYHIFFVGINNTPGDKPPLINIAQIVCARKYADVALIEKPKKSLKNLWLTKIDLIFQFIAYIYLKLTFPNHRNSYYREAEHDKVQVIYHVKSEIGELQGMIEDFLGVNFRQLDTLATHIAEGHLTDHLPGTFPEQLTFDKLILKTIQAFLKNI